ncbi:TPA: TrbC/VirB2 family protein [Proteus mirabilis]|uniref:TrbC/VirB2 family protein n=1 Tax=Klebsiella pneumoniae TaxID=573 RepID=UPI000935B157|nr:TrbC/VirB2 family protein [Klebsiella pneumoniae]HBC6189613.1 TrbC/VirB2 family protein [Proteus mirabilis]HDY2198214.1 TrbC/VirB2 family protein [Escherichia coli]RNP36827.1 hypothetical protein BL155_00009000 [Klebsiella pneumoniae]HBC9254555.1 TrbC/VirB2 family protein [Proteus mirabilis]HEK1831382.1 TrbC/VirB2 family protein [Proteus mirabilis]
MSKYFSFINNKTLLFFCAFMTSDFAMANGLSTTGGGFFSKVQDVMFSWAGAVITIACGIVGYRTMVRKESIMDCWGVILGAAILTFAPDVPGWLGFKN